MLWFLLPGNLICYVEKQLGGGGGGWGGTVIIFITNF